jgi:uncharacterized protein YuzE
MIVRQTFTGKGRLHGKAYSFDLDRDFMYIHMLDEAVAFTDYVPSQTRPEDYIIVDFDKHGRVVGFAMDGLLDAYARTSLKARIAVAALHLKLNANSALLISRAIAKVGKHRFIDALPALDNSGRLPAFAAAR